MKLRSSESIRGSLMKSLPHPELAAHRVEGIKNDILTLRERSAEAFVRIGILQPRTRPSLSERDGDDADAFDMDFAPDVRNPIGQPEELDFGY